MQGPETGSCLSRENRELHNFSVNYKHVLDGGQRSEGAERKAGCEELLLPPDLQKHIRRAGVGCSRGVKSDVQFSEREV